ncbi:uncharacterized protein LOC132565550 [Ylistrum balloti]|uniref:uncharacterized protein LOC132565550 n=1 Tax=Ylistrum balloti TaxID=509963 RepID=UPI002905DDF8|nr:uncharacterized protein LOC132565550 [Ylistrum balloti]
MAAKILEWMSSNKTIIKIGANFGILYGLSVLPGTAGLMTYKQYYQLRMRDPTAETPVVCHPNDMLKGCIYEVKNDFRYWKTNQEDQAKDHLEFEESLNDKVKFMMVPSTNPGHKGSMMSKFGCIISIPQYFMVHVLDEIPAVNSLSKGRLLSVLTKGQVDRTPRVPVDNESVDGIALRHSLLLTREEKKFVMMRELISCRSNSDYVIGVLRCVTAGTCVGLMYYVREFMMNNVGNFFSMLAKTDLQPISTLFARGSLYMLILGTSLVTYYSLLFMYKSHREKQTDWAVAAISQDYAKAGKGYYNRILSRNLSCRNILGPQDGPYLYTAKGDLKSWFFAQETPITERLAIMESYLSEYNQKENISNVNEEQTGL